MFHVARFGLAALLVVGAACQPASKTETAAMGGESAAPPAGLSAEDEAALTHDIWNENAPPKKQ